MCQLDLTVYRRLVAVALQAEADLAGGTAPFLAEGERLQLAAAEVDRVIARLGEGVGQLVGLCAGAAERQAPGVEALVAWDGEGVDGVAGRGLQRCLADEVGLGCGILAVGDGTLDGRLVFAEGDLCAACEAGGALDDLYHVDAVVACEPELIAGGT